MAKTRPVVDSNGLVLLLAFTFLQVFFVVRVNRPPPTHNPPTPDNNLRILCLVIMYMQ